MANLKLNVKVSFSDHRVRFSGELSDGDFESILVNYNGLPLITVKVVKRKFSFYIAKAKGRMPRNSLFTFVCNGQQLGDSSCVVLPEDALCDNDVNELNIIKNLKKGMVLNKKGGFNSYIIDNNVKRAYLDLYSELKDFLKREFDFSVHVTHGTLLGAVRCEDFIDGDDDFDALYLSRKMQVDEVVSERKSVFDALKKEFKVSRGSTGHIKVKKHGVTIDLMPAWHDGEHLNISSFTSMEVLLNWDGVAYHNLVGERVSSLSCYQDFLVHQYGKDWKTPDPSYRSKHGHKQKINLEILKSWINF